MRIPDTFEFLLGEWTLLRWLHDQRADVHGRFTGTASLTPTTPGCACYREVGELRLGQHVGPAGRTLRLLRRPAGTAEFTFADGRHYLTVDLRSGRWAGDHPCAQDVYRIELRTPSPDLMVERWQVRGPAKRYDALTLLRRTAPRALRCAPRPPHGDGPAAGRPPGWSPPTTGPLR